MVVEAEQQNAGQQDSGSLLAELNPERAWSQLNDVTGELPTLRAASHPGSCRSCRSYAVYILVPFFFSSIGLAIPVRQLFTPAVVWKGWVYACVMAFAKVLPGLWILLAQRLEGSVGKRLKASKRAERAIRCHRRSTEPAEPAMACPAELGAAIDIELSVSPQGPPPPSPAAAAPPAAQSEASLSGATKLSWRPALLLGLCLVSRGEVGFIIINLARGEYDVRPPCLATADRGQRLARACVRRGGHFASFRSAGQRCVQHWHLGDRSEHSLRTACCWLLLEVNRVPASWRC